MKNLHAKSPCCHGDIIKYGNRRRQCLICRKTWRIRKKKAGRKKKREGYAFVIKYLNHGLSSFYYQAQTRDVTERNLQLRLERSRDLFLRNTKWPELPTDKKLVVIADALVQYIEHSWYTIYIILVREINGAEAIVFKPFVRKGTETANGWYEAFKKLPEATQTSITALVCDGHTGLISYAKWNNWKVQRCHFHLIARIQGRRSKWKYSRHGKEGQHIYDLVNHVLTTTDENSIIKYLSEIEEIGWLSKSRDLKNILSGFVKNYKDYRTYIYSPELYLPTTSNSVESFINLIRELMHRMRGFRTISSLKKWIFALVKNKKKIKCNGFHQPS